MFWCHTLFVADMNKFCLWFLRHVSFIYMYTDEDNYKLIREQMTKMTLSFFYFSKSIFSSMKTQLPNCVFKKYMNKNNEM